MHTVALFVRFIDLHAGRLGQLAGQLGSSPAAERALRHDAALEVTMLTVRREE
jgi:hypothetical protein